MLGVVPCRTAFEGCCWLGCQHPCPPGPLFHQPQVGVSVEPLAELAQKEGSKLGAKEVSGEWRSAHRVCL